MNLYFSSYLPTFHSLRGIPVAYVCTYPHWRAELNAPSSVAENRGYVVIFHLNRQRRPKCAILSKSEVNNLK